ncbi:low-density lipoprotein receptor-related protein 2-like isoform X2 [Ptychodera flava]|uniref:low-density lipoprotein receptor-related protein 2-like isoform X2 n=1 Tax=Ptychodera flava TaxID=63121 RepID=UPI00396A76A6
MGDFAMVDNNLAHAQDEKYWGYQDPERAPGKTGDDSKDLDKSKNAKSFGSIVRKFGLETTAHGIPRIAGAKSTLGRLIWSTLFLIAAGAFARQFIILVDLYYRERPVTVHMKVVSKDSLDFPSVTVCNTNMLRNSAVRNSVHNELTKAVEGTEILPYYAPCLEGDFICSNGITCLKSYLVCDGAAQCLDGSDEDDCTYGDCASNQFKCEQGSPFGLCLDETRMCDGHPDCYDGSDEKSCVCSIVEFECKSGGNYGHCIPIEKHCDGIEHCNDGEDEKLENCMNKHGFVCDGDKRIPYSWLCDKIPDCVDVSDEMECITYDSCMPGLFTCSNQKCVLQNKVCDFHDDCGDWSDEANCTYAPCEEGQVRCPHGRCVKRLKMCDIYAGCGDNVTDGQCVRSMPCPGRHVRCEDGSCEHESTGCKEDYVGPLPFSYPDSEFQKTVGRALMSSPRKVLTNTSTERCLIACLDETEFACRAVNALRNSVCELLEESHSYSANTLLVSNVSVYFENRKASYPFDKVTAYPNFALQGYIELTVMDVDEEGCILACLGSWGFRCRSVDFWKGRGICYVNAENKWSASVNLVPDHQFIHYELHEETYPYNQFKEYPGVTSSLTEGKKVETSSSMVGCLSLCMNETLFDCVAVDWSTSGLCLLQEISMTSPNVTLLTSAEFSHFEVVDAFPRSFFFKTVTSALTSYNDHIIRRVGLDQCLRFCLEGPEFVCHSADYAKTANCYMSTETPETTATGLGTYYKTNYYKSKTAVCSGDDFACEHGWECVQSWLVCDGVRHCRDGSDEKYCDGCGDDEFLCERGHSHGETCISKDKVCDGYRDCLHGSDETQEQCRICRGFLCDETRCIKKSKVCDFIVDCRDGTDERSCHYPVCNSEKEHTCVNKLCIPLDKVCDTENDCFDWTDEWDCDYRGECYMLVNGYDYRGKVNTTVSGRHCQKWSSQTPHSHNRTDEFYSNTGLGDHSYCRNPDNEAGIWCYTTDPDVRWEFCDAGNRQQRCDGDVRKCDEATEFQCRNQYCIAKEHTCDQRNHCDDRSDEWDCLYRGECYTVHGGMDYRGTVNHTSRGIPCQRWSEQTPHQHNYSPELVQDQGLGDHNYCRNPGQAHGQLRPWCYTTDPDVVWQHCDVPDHMESCGEDACASDEFTCTSGQCIPRRYRCDHKKHCFDGSDEELCAFYIDENGKCPESTFTCNDGTCINLYFHCNVREDCPDGSDEIDCVPPEFGLGCYRGRGESYRGLVNVTGTGKPCLKWVDSKHKYIPSKKPDAGLEGNQCRNPSSDVSMRMPWCYHRDDSKDNVGWEFCDIPHCDEVTTDAKSTDTDTLPDDWTKDYKHLLTDDYLVHEFETAYFRDPGFQRVKSEVPPDWHGFMTFSSTPDFSDLQQVLKLSRREILQLGHQKEDFILQCTFDQKKCNSRDFSVFANSKYGNCFTFNHVLNGTKVRVSRRAGANNGLKLTLFTQQDEYISIFGQSSGVRVTLHPHSNQPFPEDDGITIQPGTVTSVALKEGLIKRLEPPYGECSEGHSADFNFSSSEGWAYTQVSCQHSCVRRHMLELCGCIDTHTATYSDDGPKCMIQNKKQEICRQLMYYLHHRNKLPCECRTPCLETWYGKTISQSYWPSTKYLNSLLRVLHSLNNETKKITNSELARRNLARLEIYFEELNYESVEEKPAYIFENLIGDIGGSLGLYIGLSLITVAEFLEFLCDLVAVCFSRISTSSRR